MKESLKVMRDETPRYQHIQHLRALSVLAVIGYHLKLPGFAGGYIGVDIFFVISGFLIGKKLIDADLSFKSYGRYLLRRYYRIYPVALTAALVSVVAGYYLMLPLEYRDFGASLVGFISLTMNKMVANNINYFTPLAQTQPLLHYWSLMVEFQFYILLPLIFLLLRKMGRNGGLLFLLGLFAISLYHADRLTTVDPKDSYYLLPSRAFELLIGVGMAIWAQHANGQNHRPPNGLAPYLFWVSASLVILSIPIYSDLAGHPGYVTLPALFFAAFYIHYGTLVPATDSRVARMGAYLGEISFSLYVWHYVFLVFLLSYLNIEASQMGWGQKAALAGVTLVVGHFSFRHIEHRACLKMSVFGLSRRVYVGALTGVLLVSGVVIFFKDGLYDSWQKRADPTQVKAESIYRNANTLTWNEHQECSFWTSNFGEPETRRINECLRKASAGRILILGDSHAIDLFRALSRQSDAIPPSKHRILIGLASGGCKPYLQGPNCYIQDLKKNFDKLEGRFDKVLYVQRGTGLPDQADFSGSVRSPQVENFWVLVDYLEFLQKIASQVVWIGPRIERGVEKNIFIRNGCAPNSKLDLSPTDTRDSVRPQFPSEFITKKLPAGLVFVAGERFDMAPQSCSQPYWRDPHHWSVVGAQQQTRALNGLLIQ